MTVTLTWVSAQGETGYNIYRNGTLITKLGQTAISYTDNAPRMVDLKYQVEPINDYVPRPAKRSRSAGVFSRYDAKSPPNWRGFFFIIPMASVA